MWCLLVMIQHCGPHLFDKLWTRRATIYHLVCINDTIKPQNSYSNLYCIIDGILSSHELYLDANVTTLDVMKVQRLGIYVQHVPVTGMWDNSNKTCSSDPSLVNNVRVVQWFRRELFDFPNWPTICILKRAHCPQVWSKAIRNVRVRRWDIQFESPYALKYIQQDIQAIIVWGYLR